MITAQVGPLISRPEAWIVVFDEKPANRWIGRLVPGQYKHVRAYGYVPFLHVWLFVDANLAGIEVLVAANGDPANALADSWTRNCDVVIMRRRAHAGRSVALAACGWCVPVVRRLIGLDGGALRPDALFADCLGNGGQFYGRQRTPSTPRSDVACRVSANPDVYPAAD